MKPDLYVKVLLTIIAACLVALTLGRRSLMPTLRAAAPITCTGDMKATSASQMQAAVGASYRIEVTCN